MTTNWSEYVCCEILLLVKIMLDKWLDTGVSMLSRVTNLDYMKLTNSFIWLIKACVIFTTEKVVSNK